MAIYEPGDIVVVPFPFTDREATKHRPALVLSPPAFNEESGTHVLAMITSAKQSSWPLDCPITDLVSAGLSSPSIVRMKLFTLHARLILRRTGVVAATDKQAIAHAVRGIVGTWVATSRAVV